MTVAFTLAAISILVSGTKSNDLFRLNLYIMTTKVSL